MKRLFVRILCCFIPVRRWRHVVRAVFDDAPDRSAAGTRVADVGADGVPSREDSLAGDNHIFLVAPDGTRRAVDHVPNCEFIFKGEHNNVYLHEPLGALHLRVEVHADVNITIEPVGKRGARLNVLQDSSGIGHVNNLTIRAGLKTTGMLQIELVGGGPGDVVIGRECLFSWGCFIRTGDYHTIVEKGTGRVLNHNRSVVIGNNVWVGSDVMLLKGAGVPDGSVVGTRSLVTRAFDTANVVIAGVPARIIRENIEWNQCSISDYEKETACLAASGNAGDASPL